VAPWQGSAFDGSVQPDLAAGEAGERDPTIVGGDIDPVNDLTDVLAPR
jgi:hypothetical protein